MLLRIVRKDNPSTLCIEKRSVELCLGLSLSCVDIDLDFKICPPVKPVFLDIIALLPAKS